MKDVLANSKMKHKSTVMLEVIRYLVLDFLLYFVTISKKYPLHATQVQYNV